MHYYPMESDPTIPEAEKRDILQEWFSKDFGLMASVGYTQQDFVKMVQTSKILFRNGVTELLEFSKLT